MIDFKSIERIPVGPSVFFRGMRGFINKFRDYVCLIPRMKWDGNPQIMRAAANQLFLYPAEFSKDEYIEHALNNNDTQMAGKFLSPAFISRFGITMEDLERLEPLFERLEGTQAYERAVYGFYKENGKPELTKEQREAAFAEYKGER